MSIAVGSHSGSRRISSKKLKFYNLNVANIDMRSQSNELSKVEKKEPCSSLCLNVVDDW
jgi:hypothetical protein